MQKISPFLWLEGQAEEAMRFYVSVFPNSRIVSANAMSVSAELDGQRFLALNGGPQFKFTPAISFFVDCQTQREVDELWDKLCAGGEPSKCGWLTDKYGVSWQIVPSVLGPLLNHPQKGAQVMQAMLGMRKLDIAALERAAA
jgi:predicted 3-demethylubiquinone-9 3-methyltransferase (glyoxalase superfamily)